MKNGPNTENSNVVKMFMDYSAQDSAGEFQPSDFQDEPDSTILVRERAKVLNWNRHLPKKTGKSINDSEDTVSILPESTKWAKTFSKREIASARNTHREKNKKAARRKRAILSESTSNSETEEPQKKKIQKKKRREGIRLSLRLI